MTKLLIKFALSSIVMLFVGNAYAQNVENDVLEAFVKHMNDGDADNLASCFSDQMEIAILDAERNSSRNQARERMRVFFRNYTPKSFAISHTAGRQDIKCAIGELAAGGSLFTVTIYVGGKEKPKKIQYLKIENSR